MIGLGKEPNEGAPYAPGPAPPGNPVAPKEYSHTVGGAGIVLEPSGNKLLDPVIQRAGYETEYVLNFYVKSGGAPVDATNPNQLEPGSMD